MTTYSTRTLAEALIGDDSKASTRLLRKFLRDELGEGKAVVGKGGRYALDYNKRELTALTKKFAKWTIQQEEDKAARAALRDAINAKRAESAESPIEDEAPETDEAPEGPSDEEIAAMLSDDEETDDEV